MSDDTRENPDGQMPRIATGEFRIPITRIPVSDTPAWLDRLARAEALGRASGIAAERERCAKIAHNLSYHSLAARIESGE